MRDRETPTVEELWQRVHVLERRRAERVVSVVGLVALLVLTTGAATLVPDTLAAKSFRLVDNAGDERAALVATGAGGVSLSVYDAKGALAAELVLAPTEPFLSVIDGRGNRAAVSPATPASEPAAAKPLTKPVQPSKPPPGKEDDSFDWLN